MDNFKDLFKKQHMGQVILLILFIIYLIMGYKTPDSLANLIDNVYGKVFVIVIALLLFSTSNPILGIVGFIVAYELIRRSVVKTGTYALNNYMPTEKKKASNLTAFNQFPYTLEQEIVKKMAPIEKTVSSNSTYAPILDDLHDAAPIDYNGVV